VWLVAALLLIYVVCLAAMYYLWQTGVIGPPLIDGMIAAVGL
jgi:hypothetical protein